MKEATKPKYLLLKDNKDNHRSFGSLNSKTTYIRRNVTFLSLRTVVAILIKPKYSTTKKFNNANQQSSLL